MNISEVEKSLAPKRKALLQALRAEGWDVVDVSTDERDWALDQVWSIVSCRESAGAELSICFFLSESGNADSIDNAIAWIGPLERNRLSSPYMGPVTLYFDSRGFEDKLSQFLGRLDQFRKTGSLD